MLTEIAGRSLIETPEPFQGRRKGLLERRRMAEPRALTFGLLKRGSREVLRMKSRPVSIGG